ncbi:hypothetical protein ONZ45_g14611 [Pleurotus djamor]|nr:hypothetical protein ONZ45_g14611 [Pleurotus djamor]
MVLYTDATGQATLDVQIAQLEVILQNLRQRRNELCAIHNLPSEILSHIFVAFKKLTLPDYKPGTWLNISAICRRWRNILLSTPQFWASISILDSPNVDEMVERSKQVPLQLDFSLCYHFHQRDGYHEDRYDLVSEVHWAGALDRVESISIDFPDGLVHIVEQIFESVGYVEVPSLRRLRIEASALYGLDLPFQMPWAAMSSLQSLIILDATISLDGNIPLLQSLTKVVLSDHSGIGISLSFIIRFLRQAPNVVQVQLGRYITDDLSTDEQNVSPFALTKVEEFIIEGCHLTASRIFDFLILPISTRVVAEFTEYKDLECGAPYLSSLKSICSRVNLDAMCQMAETLLYSNTFSDEASQRLTFHFKAKTAPFLDFSINLTFGDRIELYSSYIPLFQVANLTIGQMYDAHHHWTNFLRHFTKLKVLAFKNGGAYTCSMVLQDSIEDDFRAYYPELDVISFISANFSYGDVEKVLTKFLTKRRDIGIPIRKLLVRDCTISQELIDILRELVEVDWDGGFLQKPKNFWEL